LICNKHCPLLPIPFNAIGLDDDSIISILIISNDEYRFSLAIKLKIVLEHTTSSRLLWPVALINASLQSIILPANDDIAIGALLFWNANLYTKFLATVSGLVLVHFTFDSKSIEVSKFKRLAHTFLWQLEKSLCYEIKIPARGEFCGHCETFCLVHYVEITRFLNTYVILFFIVLSRLRIKFIVSVRIDCFVSRINCTPLLDRSSFSSAI
jgi:hypothetical protein